MSNNFNARNISKEEKYEKILEYVSWYFAKSKIKKSNITEINKIMNILDPYKQDFPRILEMLKNCDQEMLKFYNKVCSSYLSLTYYNSHDAIQLIIDATKFYTPGYDAKVVAEKLISSYSEEMYRALNIIAEKLTWA